MGILNDRIEKAIERSKGLDLRELSRDARANVPAQLAGDAEKQQRANFLAKSRDPEIAAKLFERILAGNELQDVNYLSRGSRAAMAVGCINAPSNGGRLAGTGFITSPSVLITNNHVIASAAAAADSTVTFNFQLDDHGNPLATSTYRLAPERLFYTTPGLDFTIVAVEDRVASGFNRPLSLFGHLPLLGTTGKAMEGEWLTIIQHPEGKRKMICVRENQLLKRDKDVLWYSSDTLGGSSGSPVFNNDWFVVALHHSGVPATVDGAIQTVDGSAFDPSSGSELDIKWIANEGIRASRIVETLHSELSGHPLLRPLFQFTPTTARIVESAPTFASPLPHDPRLAEAKATNTLSERRQSMSRTVQVTLEIDETGNATVIGSAAVKESFDALEKSSGQREKKLPKVKIDFDDNYNSPKRKGFISDFLGNGADDFFIHRPVLTQPKLSAAARIINKPDNYELNYIGYTVVIHAKRKLAMYSAASINFEHRHAIDSRTDTWRSDPRILDEHQLDDSYYSKKRKGRDNKFDKGHLTRNEDMEFGSDVIVAAEQAVDTFHYTNRAPQHQNFNRQGYLWQDLELHILENSIKANNFRAQVITGPVLAQNDPIFKLFGDIPYPERFWKVAIAINSKSQLVAVAFLLDQSGVIDEDGLEAVGELPFRGFTEYQVKVSEIERLTGLKFFAGKTKKQPLSTFDPMEGVVISKRTRRGGAQESTGQSEAPEGYLLLDSLESVVLE